MPRNSYISLGTTNEQNLLADLIIESTQIHGHDVYYLPRNIVNLDTILNEPIESHFGDAFKIEMYLENVDGYEGDGTLLAKFGLEIRNQIKLIVARRRWDELVGRFNVGHTLRPAEGDLIYFPMVKGLFEIRFMEGESPFYQLSNLPTYKLTCELFEYGHEQLDTGIDVVDSIENDYSPRITITIDTGSGTFLLGEKVSQVIGDGISVTGEVAEVRSGEIDITQTAADDGKDRFWQLTAASVDYENIIGTDSAATYTIIDIDQFTPVQDNDPVAQNTNFETDGNALIDFTEDNPFGEANFLD